MKVKIGINGYGRIGRAVLRLRLVGEGLRMVRERVGLPEPHALIPPWHGRERRKRECTGGAARDRRIRDRCA
jgi:hypothetical protein